MPFLYETWPGDNRFCCGCLIAGPLRDCAANSCWYVCALISLIPVSIFITPSVWNVSPALSILFYLSIAFTTFFLNLTSCTDPGIVPRKPYLIR
jgi:hypothetical protein